MFLFNSFTERRKIMVIIKGDGGTTAEGSGINVTNFRDQFGPGISVDGRLLECHFVGNGGTFALADDF